VSGTSGNLLATDAVICCPHGGRAAAAQTSSPAVLIGGRAVATTATYIVTGCTHTAGGVPQPCTSVRFAAAASGITVGGAPVLLDTSAAQCLTAAFLPQGPPVVQAAQRKVTVR
jgi:hypothetical protein